LKKLKTIYEMKKYLLNISFCILTVSLFGQTNTFPTSGNVGIGTTSPLTTLDVNGGTLLRGSNSNIPASPISGVELFTGRNYFNNLISGQSTGDIAIQYGGSSGGFRHFITTLHNSAATGNQMRFYLNTSGTVSGSSAPGTGNVNVLTLASDNGGEVGIGTTNPETNLHVIGNARFTGTGWFSRNNNGSLSDALYLGQNNSWDWPSILFSTSDAQGSNVLNLFSTRWGTTFNFQRSSPIGTKNIVQILGQEGHSHSLSIFASSDGATQKIMFTGDGNSFITGGNLLIGKTNQTNTNYSLDVAGNIRANKLVVNATGADFVFAKKYHLISLTELEKYIHQNKHLPGIKTAVEMSKEGVDVGNNETKLLQKMEELTLYIIEMKKENDNQKRAIERLNRMIKTIQGRNITLNVQDSKKRN
jgi:hypothetical protein